ncbi:MAG: serine hydrolase domain-containing protein [Bacteroidota bacterium]
MKTILKFSLLLLLILSCVEKKRPIGKEIRDIPSLLDTLNNSFEKLYRKSGFPGTAISLVNKDSIIFIKGVGYADLEGKKEYTENTIHPIASISKTFVGVALMKLVEQGKLDLNERINDILPYSIINPFFPEDEILVKHLATHTSTIPHYFDDFEKSYWLLEPNTIKKGEIPDENYNFLISIENNKPLSLDEYIQNVCTKNGEWYDEKDFVKSRPGLFYNYSNVGTSVAARIIEIRSGRSFSDYTKEFILNPLKMSNSAWFYDDIDDSLLSKPFCPDDRESPTMNYVFPRNTYQGYPEGHLISSVADLSKYMMEMLKGYYGQGTILKKGSYKKLFEPQLTAENFINRDDSEFSTRYNVGIFWGISGKGYIIHDGGEIGVFSFAYFNPETGIGGIGMCNSRINAFGEIRNLVARFEKKIAHHYELKKTF